jgi:hypothetical protein
MANPEGSYDFADPVPPKRPAPPRKKEPPPPVARADAAPPVPVAAPATQDAGRFCPYCGSVFGGKGRARCPECSAPLDAAADLYQFADPRWVRGQATGLMLIIPGIALHVVGAVLQWEKAFEAKGIAHLAAAVLVAAGVLLATRREPRTLAKGSQLPPVAKPSPLVPWVRLLALASLVAWIILAWIAFGPGVGLGTIKAFLLPLLVCQAVLAALLANLVSGMASRLPSDSLSTHSIYSGWGTAAVCITLFFIQLFEMNKGDYPMFFMCSFPLVAGLVTLLVWAMITLLRMGLEMRVSATAGENIAAQRAQKMARKQR